MAGVDEQIAASRAKKKAGIRKASLVLLTVLLVGAAAAVVLQMLPAQGELEQQTKAPSQSNASTPALSDEARRELQQALDDTRQQLLSRLTDPISRWAPDRAHALSERLDNAYGHYGKGDFADAQAELVQVSAGLPALIRDWQRAYQAAYEEAYTAFASDDIYTAQQRNQQALNINPDFESAQSLQQRIAVFDDVTALYEQARVGKVENNLEKQQRAYARIVELDPERQDAHNALEQINAALDEQNFAQALSRAVAAVEKDDLEAAQQYLNKAASLKPQSTEVATLKARINKLQKQREAGSVEKQLTMFSQLDEWKTVHMLATKGIAAHPNNPAIQRALDTAGEVLAAKERLARYLDAPGRLADNNIRQRAADAVADTRALSEVSAGIKEDIQQLERLIEKENTPLEVTVLSDGNSHLKVLGVGHIGQITRKTIQLKPGHYRFEASREGYRTKIIEVDVQKSAMPMEIYLACTQAI